MIPLLLGCIFAFGHLARKAVQYWRCVRLLRGFPGYRVLLAPPGILTAIVPPLPAISLRRAFNFEGKYKNCQKFGYDAFSVVAAFPIRASIFLADPQAIKEVTSSRFRYVKPVETYATLAFFGQNVVTTEGSEWVAHRKITAPAFTERSIPGVCEDSAAVMNELFDDWGNAPSVRISDVTVLTTKLTLSVIARSGFGQVVRWTGAEAVTAPLGHTMPFMRALELTIPLTLIRVAIPSFFWGSPEDRKEMRVAGLAGKGWLGKTAQTTSLVFSELKTYITEMIHERRTSQMQRADLLSNLVEAMDAGYDRPDATDQDIIGNIFIFLIAGHETTSHAFAFALGLLALYPDVQDEIYRHVANVLPEGRSVRPQDLDSLDSVLGIFYEALRLYPPVTRIPKRCTEDTVISVLPAISSSKESSNETAVQVPIMKGVEVVVDVAALHHNPRYWEDPMEFKPSRFLKPDWPKDAFLPFSSGMRSCVGRRFAETEAVVVLSMLLNRYKVQPDPERFQDRPGETPLQRRGRLLKAEDRITLTPAGVPLLFTRR